MNKAPEHAAGGAPLLETMLFVPRRRPDLVSRPRLIERLHRGSERKLTLVSAPAGFGKTTLLAAWLATPERESAGWVSLDASDNDPNSFWSYVIAAVERTCPEPGERARTMR